MRRPGRITVKSFAVVLAVAAALAAGSARAASVEQGGQLARDNCGGCHATGGQGPSPNTEAPPFRVLGQRYPIEDLQESLAEGIVTGHPAMPQFVFSPEHVADLIAYLKSIQVGRPATPQESH
jgi:mono/diheme cytochrome c family protein